MLKPWIADKVWRGHYRSYNLTSNLSFICIIPVKKKCWLRYRILLMCDSSMTPSIIVLSHIKLDDSTLFYFKISSLGIDIYHLVAQKIDVFVGIGRVEPEVNSPLRNPRGMPFETNWYWRWCIIWDICCWFLKINYKIVKCIKLH